MDGIKAHCMGMEFPKRVSVIGNTVTFRIPAKVRRKCGCIVTGTWDNVISACDFHAGIAEREFPKRDTDSPNVFWLGAKDVLPSAADLDAVAEEQKAKEQTSGKTDRSQP